jgi:hypothetical protein
MCRISERETGEFTSALMLLASDLLASQYQGERRIGEISKAMKMTTNC